MKERVLKQGERVMPVLRDLYRGYGYLPFKMSKFEEYDLYVRNKDFLVSDRIITFNDTNGKLMALKPDVTLSIIKHGEDAEGVKQKVYYNESVYRVSERTGQFREIMQVGLECVGDIDGYDLYETVLLAAKSLEAVSERFVLDVSHLGIPAAFLEEIGRDSSWNRRVAACLADRNRHELAALCEGLEEKQTARLCALTEAYGDPAGVIDRLKPLCDSPAAAEALAELEALAALLQRSPCADRIRFDFSIVNDMSYYNGIVFRGYLAGISEGVLSGGQYDKLLRRMGRRAGAVGFALYPDLLEELSGEAEEFDVDVLVLYDRSVPAEQLADTVNGLVARGLCVSAQRCIPAKLKYKELRDLRKGEGV